MTSTFEQEVKQGDRFEFGKNWRGFLSVLNDARIAEAEKSLKQMLVVEDLQSKTFLDIGSGSGLFSLAARRLGAKVHSFDYDTESVACTQELKCRYFPNDSNWTIEQGSVLDVDYIKSLGKFDIIYAWGVLHHTGAMWQALENAIFPVAEQGILFIAIYNDQGRKSKIWRRIKQVYCSGIAGRTLISALFIPYFILSGLIVDLVKGRNPIIRYTEYKNSRGMSRVYDWLDWLGGYPFEVAKPEDIFNLYENKNFVLEKFITSGGGSGNNQFVFIKG
ncbi:MULTISPECIES: class I SAM-dependent methyltransferase [unclassified Coleofasciculus]|uniref:class I SAM-dependent methyltransferase n=1 Tax=Cyanophyceae TaxID=3028117 RepID=UPI0016857968|nr:MULTISPECIES: class I SAM-dependent methyltransferase [unclassified Coleofasciculus]MBD1896892.1 class I SAM-dependent methyltransferase [Coleofasciculus sp. FACHB-129]MBD2087547.1 class I SAM-dependent methyltransferase [Coleofasciculus sp. FACHB-542]